MKPSKLLFSAGSLIAAAALFMGASSAMFLNAGSASADCPYVTGCSGQTPVLVAVEAVSTNNPSTTPQPPANLPTIDPPPAEGLVEYAIILALVYIAVDVFDD